MDLTNRKIITETAAAKRNELERDAKKQKSIGVKNPSDFDLYVDRIRNQKHHSASEEPNDRDKSQLFVAISIADPETQRFNPKIISSDLGVVSRNASSRLYALDGENWPIITDKGFSLAAQKFEVQTEGPREKFSLELLDRIKKRLAQMPETEREATVEARVEQTILREYLLENEKTCQVSGLNFPELLRVSHIKPRAYCSADDKKNLDNVILLAAHLDAAFDKHLISFDEIGRIMISEQLNQTTRELLGLTSEMRLRNHVRHEKLMTEHRGRLRRLAGKSRRHPA